MFMKKLLTVSLIGFTLVCNGELVQNESMSEVVTKKPHPMDAEVIAQRQGQSLVRASQLRCWQWGRLVFAENGVRSTESSKTRFLKEGKQKLQLFDYGETFCIYLGERGQ